MPPKRILIFGGTGEARDLANRLTDDGFAVVTSLAGVTKSPHLPRGEVHRGRLGGADGIARYVTSEGFDLIVDATHPFATKISGSVAAVGKQLGVKCIRLEREAWVAGSDDRWIEVADLKDAAAAVPANSRVLATTGQRGLEPFLARTDLSGVVRVIESPSFGLPARWRLLQARPPYSIAEERRLLDEEHITVLVTKSSGGEAATAKLIAARERKIPVVMIARPPKPPMLRFSNVETLVEALKA